MLVSLWLGCAGGEVAGPTGALLLNEYLADYRGDADPAQSGDWVEIFNPGDAEVPLLGWTLASIDNLDVGAWMFPDEAILPAGGWLLVSCGHALDIPYQAPFPLDRQGDALVLRDAETAVADSVGWAELTEFDLVSRARVPDGGDTWVAGPPTPGASNGE